MTITTEFAAGMFGSQRHSADLRSLSSTLADLNRQLATGRRAETLGGLSAGRSAVLTMRADLARLDGHDAAAQRGVVRIGMMTGVLDHIGGIARDARATAMNAGMTAESQRGAIAAARANLDGVISQLNTDFDGQFLFSGRAANTEPVANVSTILDGAIGADGLRTLIAERRAADAGSGLGRLTLGVAASTVSLSEEAAGLPFGFKLSGASAGGGLSLTGPAGTPAGVAITATGVAAGDSFSLTLTLPDGTREAVTLAARAAGTTGGANSFAVGADDAATAANLSAALDGVLREKVGSVLAGASASVAAEDFFAGTASAPARRIAGPPFESATGFAAAGSRPTVQWYFGEDSAGDPRQSQLLGIDKGVTLGVGARANEAPVRKVLAGLAMVAAEAGGSNAVRQNATLERSRGLLAQDGNGTISSVSTDLAQAGASMEAVSKRHGAHANLIHGLLADIEQPSLEELSASILSLQTRLQASYQVTASLSRLSLAEYL